MAQKFALAPDKLLNYLDEEVDWSTTKVCSLNVDEANTWNFGQMLPLILLFQFILAGMGAFYGRFQSQPNPLRSLSSAWNQGLTSTRASRRESARVAACKGPDRALPLGFVRTDVF
ncbi:hypothetical protein HDK64DRAFT_250948 [Phyllosticta capitalensis]